MKGKRDIILKSKNGMALAGVVVLLFVLSLMGTAMYAYSMDSLNSIRFASDRKKAEYLAQAGVEAASYAYQKAVNNPESAPTFTGFVTEGTKDGNYIVIDRVYMIWDKTEKEYKYLSEDDYENIAITNYELIGYYYVKIENSEVEYDLKLGTADSTNAGDITYTDTTLTSRTKTFSSTGCVIRGEDDTVNAGDANADVKRAKKAYIADPQQAFGTYYGDDGVFDTSLEGYKQLGTFTSKSELSLTMNLFGTITIPITERTTNIYLGYSAGNMILSESSAKALTMTTDQSNIITMIGMDKLFVRSSIDVTPTQKYFNILTLRGNDIVVDGDIEIYVFCIARRYSSSLLGTLINNATTIRQALQGMYRLGTVIIGTPSKAGTTVTDPYKTGSVYDFGECGRIYFGGNVYVNIQMLNVGTYRYKAFSAGDAYYYDDNISVSSGSDLCGIDLLKYFLDSSIAKKSYSSTVLTRFEEVLNLYYGIDKTILNDGSYTTNADNGSYVLATTNGTVTKDSMRKIDIDQFGDFRRTTIPPSATDASSLVWYAD